MKGLITLYLALMILPASGTGWDREFNELKKYKNSINISSGYFYDSDAITNEYAIGYLNNEFLTDEMKDRVSTNLSDLNRFGAEIINEASYTRYPDSLFTMRNCFYTVSVSNNYHVNSRFSRDAFEIYFRGNKDYAGETAQVSDFVYQNLLYQQINFTFGHSFKRTENWFGYSAGVSFNLGQKLFLIEADRASIYTEPTGEYIEMDINGEVHLSDSAKTDLGSVNGMGASADLSFFWKTKNNNTLTISGKNFGFINWNSKSTYISADTLFHFEGVDVSYLFDITDSIHESISLDSSLVEPYLTNRTKNSFTSPLPSWVKLNYQYILTEGKTNLEGEVGYLLFATAQPYESIKLNYELNNHHHFGVKVRYGGYGSFNAGLSYRLRFLERWLFTIESDYLSSMINPQNTMGHGSFASLSAYF